MKQALTHLTPQKSYPSMGNVIPPPRIPVSTRIQSGNFEQMFTSPSATSASRAYTSSVAASACTHSHASLVIKNNGAKNSRRHL